jgi:hypothetical protein
MSSGRSYLLTIHFKVGILVLESSKHARESTVRLMLQLHLLDYILINLCLIKPSVVSSCLKCGACNNKVRVMSSWCGRLGISEGQKMNRR